MNHEQALSAMLQDLSREASKRAELAVYPLAQLVDPPHMSTIFMNSANVLMISGVRVMAALSARDSNLMAVENPLAIALFRAYGRAMQHYPDPDAMARAFAAEATAITKLNVEAP